VLSCSVKVQVSICSPGVEAARLSVRDFHRQLASDALSQRRKEQSSIDTSLTDRLYEHRMNYKDSLRVVKVNDSQSDGRIAWRGCR
jgi:hypothetical protein